MIVLSNKADCCGCTACCTVCPKAAISMQEDEQGFLYPTVDSKLCVDCGLCSKVCPTLNATLEEKVSQRAFLLQIKDKKILEESASGGAFSAIAKCVIKKGGVVFGAAYRDDFSVAHRFIDNEEDLKLFRNSKYVQSDMTGVYSQVKSIILSERYVCFSGTPCQIEGLLNYLGGGSPYLLTVDIVCHAVPSPAVWRSYLKILKENGITNIRDLRFRDKSKYGYLYSQFAVVSDMTAYEGIEKNIMLRAFFSEICNRPSCYSCRFKKQYRRSDITLWDCFDVSKFTSSKKFDVNKGVSRVLFHGEKSLPYIKELFESCILEEIPVETALGFDAREFFYSAEKNQKYNDFWQSFELAPEKTLKQYFPIGIKEIAEERIRKLSYNMGIYSTVRAVYKKLFGNRKR